MKQTMRCIFSGTPFHTPPFLLRLEDHLSSSLRHFCKVDVSVFMMTDKFHNGDLAFELCKKAFILSGFWNHSFWYLYHISHHTLLLVTRMSVWGLSIFCVRCYAVKKECSLQQNKNKKHQTKRREVGVLRGKQCRASHCIWPWRSQTTPTLVTGSALRSPSCGGLGVMAPHFLKVITFLRVCHMASSLGL